MASPNRHPNRDSKLTRLLQDSARRRNRSWSWRELRARGPRRGVASALQSGILRHRRASSPSTSRALRRVRENARTARRWRLDGTATPRRRRTILSVPARRRRRSRAGLQLRRDRSPLPDANGAEEHQEQAQDQRRSQGRHAPRVPGRDPRLKAQLQGKGTYDENGEWQAAPVAASPLAIDATQRLQESILGQTADRVGAIVAAQTSGAASSPPTMITRSVHTREQKEYKEVEKIVHKEVPKEVRGAGREEELSKVRGTARRSSTSSARRHAGPRRS